MAVDRGEVYHISDQRIAVTLLKSSRINYTEKGNVQAIHVHRNRVVQNHADIYRFNR